LGAAIDTAGANPGEAGGQGYEREFDFTDRDFEGIRKRLYDETGIALSDSKRDLAYGRLARVLRKKGLDSFKDYLAYLKSAPSDETAEFVNSLTTNVTSFFREGHQFEILGAQLLPERLAQVMADGSRRLRVWSAACSTGQEPYSIAMVLAEGLAGYPGIDAKILASDLDSEVVKQASAGVYEERLLDGISRPRQKRWLWKGKGKNKGKARVVPELRDLITFKQLNLMHPFPMKGPFDFVFCRNVVIYFDKKTQIDLFDRIADVLAIGGHLFIGHSESLMGLSDRFEFCGGNVYRRIS